MQHIKLVFWLVLSGFIYFFLSEVGSILAPFIASMVIAYLLNPLTIYLENYGIKRIWTVTIIVGGFFFLLVTSLMHLIPILFEQVKQFIVAIPQYKQYVADNIVNKVELLISNINPKLSLVLRDHLNELSTTFFEYTLAIIDNVFHSGIAILNIVGLVFFTPILVFYLLRDWPIITNILHKILPLQQKDMIIDQCHQIDTVLSAYIRGQILVCLILASFYVTSLSLVGLDYALLVGIIAGFLVIIPYLGLIIGGTICILVSLLQFAEIKYVYISLAIFITGHICESYIITPKLVGEKVGLHPVWIIFALMAGGSLFGFWGMFLAIPVAAIIGVLIRSLIRIYLASEFYTAD